MVRKKVNKKKNKGKDSEKVCETFEVANKKSIKTCGTMSKEHATKKQIQEQNKLLRNVIIGIIFLFLAVVGTYFIVNQMKYFEYEGMKFDVIKDGSVVFYHTSFPMFKGVNHVSNFNIYLRNHPKRTDQNIEFVGDLHLKEKMIINSTNTFVCGGTGAISVANIVQIFDALGTEVGQDPEAECDEQGRYMYVLLVEGEETKIEQFGPSCYKLYINDCEILEVTERFIIEALKQVD